jgi:hypothetical protein
MLADNSLQRHFSHKEFATWDKLMITELWHGPLINMTHLLLGPSLHSTKTRVISVNSHNLQFGNQHCLAGIWLAYLLGANIK